MDGMVRLSELYVGRGKRSASPGLRRNNATLRVVPCHGWLASCWVLVCSRLFAWAGMHTLRCLLTGGIEAFLGGSPNKRASPGRSPASSL